MSSEITRAALKAEGEITPGPLGEAMKAFAADPEDAQAIATLSADPGVNPMLRTTCVATQIGGGHAPNALPQRAWANINCRIFPGVSSSSIKVKLGEILADPTAKIVRQDDGGIDSPPSPLRPDVVAAVTRTVHARFPGLTVTAGQESGASDSMYFRAAGVPSYGVSGLVMEEGQSFIHGLNEKAPVAAIDGDLAHWDSLLRDIAK